MSVPAWVRGLERRLTDLEARPLADSIVGDDGINDGRLRMIVINGFCGNLMGASLATSKVRVYFDDMVRRIYGTIPAGAKYALHKNGTAPVWFTDRTACYHEAPGSESGKVVLLDIRIATAAEVLLTHNISYIEIQNNMGLV